MGSLQDPLCSSILCPEYHQQHGQPPAQSATRKNPIKEHSLLPLPPVNVRRRPRERRELQKVARYIKNALPSPLLNTGKPLNRQGAWGCCSLEKGETRCWKRRYQQGSLLFHWLPWQQLLPICRLSGLCRRQPGSVVSPVCHLQKGWRGIRWLQQQVAMEYDPVVEAEELWKELIQSQLCYVCIKEVPRGLPERASPATQQASTMREASIVETQWWVTGWVGIATLPWKMMVPASVCRSWQVTQAWKRNGGGKGHPDCASLTHTKPL